MGLPTFLPETFQEKLLKGLINLPRIARQTGVKMGVAQMLAHCNVTYEMVYENKHPKLNLFMSFLF